MKPGFPIMYLLDGPHGKFKVDNVARTYNQLQLVDKKEKYPSKKLIKNVAKQDQFIVEKILGEKKIRGKRYLHVSWAGFDESENTWEPLSHLKKENPELIAEYEQSK